MPQFKMRKVDDTAEVFIYGDIGAGMWGDGVSAKQFAEQLKSLGKVSTIALRINSSGGDVFEGVAIYNQLKRQKAKVTVDIDGSALSIASVIAMAADPGELRMADNAFMMIHDPWSFTVGDAKEHRKTAELLDGIKSQIVNTYVARTQRDAEEIANMMAEETWLDAVAAESLGFIDSRTSELAIAAHVNPTICRNMPEYAYHMQQLSAAAQREKTESLKKTLDLIKGRL